MDAYFSHRPGNHRNGCRSTADQHEEDQEYVSDLLSDPIYSGAFHQCGNLAEYYVLSQCGSHRISEGSGTEYFIAVR